MEYSCKHSYTLNECRTLVYLQLRELLTNALDLSDEEEEDDSEENTSHDLHAHR